MGATDLSGRLLDGIRILDLADEKGSFCSKVLADMGASVIKVEKPGGDPSRKIGPFWGNSPTPEKSLFFSYHNTNKRGITLDLEMKEREGPVILDSIEQVLSDGPRSFILHPSPQAACSNKPHQGSCCQALDGAAACYIDQTTL